MAKERKILFDLSEVTAVRLKCKEESCKGEIVLDPNRGQVMPTTCPLCRLTWIYREVPAESTLIDSINAIRGNGDGPVDLFIELKDDGPERA